MPPGSPIDPKRHKKVKKKKLYIYIYIYIYNPKATGRQHATSVS